MKGARVQALSGNWILHAATKIEHGTNKTQCRQIKKYIYIKDLVNPNKLKK